MKRPTTARRPVIGRAVRIAHLAGLGMSAREIGDEIDVGREYVLKVLWRHRIQLIHKTPDQTAFPIVVSKKAMDEALILAVRFKLDPQWMIGRLVEAVLDERPLAINLLDDIIDGAPK